MLLMLCRPIGVVACFIIMLGGGCATTSSPSRAPTPGDPPPLAISDLEKAVADGRRYLLDSQNPDGSWGSPRRTKGMNIYAPVPGAHDAFRAACTSLALQALNMTEDGTPQCRTSRRKALEWLLAELPNVKRATPDTLYNIWSHTYALQALLAERRGADASLKSRIDRAIRHQISQLERYALQDGGWSYYDFRAHTKVPSGSSFTFVTGAVMLALDQARTAGFEVNDRMTQRALAAMRRQRNANFSYVYGEYLRWWPNSGGNRPGGGLGRAQVCNLAMKRWGDERIDDRVLTAWLDRLISRQLWMDMGRKRPRPHESWFHVAGYYYYFGHYYASRVLADIPASRRDFYARHLITILLKHQEPDGSWWDFPLYDYHQSYGTGFALMTLRQCGLVLAPEK